MDKKLHSKIKKSKRKRETVNFSSLFFPIDFLRGISIPLGYKNNNKAQMATCSTIEKKIVCLKQHLH